MLAWSLQFCGSHLEWYSMANSCQRLENKNTKLYIAQQNFKEQFNVSHSTTLFID